MRNGEQAGLSDSPDRSLMAVGTAARKEMQFIHPQSYPSVPGLKAWSAAKSVGVE
jgi:hypothetical protein